MIGEEKGSVAVSGRSSHKMTGLLPSACYIGKFREGGTMGDFLHPVQ